MIRPSADPILSQRYQFLDQLMSTPAISPNGVTAFLCISNPVTKGIDISFALTNAIGISSMALLRASVMDVAQSTTIQSFTASESSFAYSDVDAVLQATGQAFYWLRLDPKNPTGSPVTVGPQFVLLNPSLLPPSPATAISASHAAAVNGTVLVTVNVKGAAADASIRIGVTGYEGNASQVIVASGPRAPFQFNLQQTGETVTFEAITASIGGAPALSGPTCTLTLGATATVPAQIQGLKATQIATGNQIEWPASLEAGVTAYQLWRGQRGDAFALASLLASIAATGAGTMIYLDTAGLSADYQYFVIAVHPSGNGPVSDPANPQIMFSSVLVPTNVGANTTNTAILDSIDAGSSTTIRIYGPGGLGSSYTRKLGYGPTTRPAGSITGLAYSTRYYLIYESGTYLASTSYSDSLPDGYEWVGTIVTCPVGGTPGTGATGSAFASPTAPYQLTAAILTAGGYGYGTASVTVSGGSGTGAVVLASCSGGSVQSLTISNPGTGYTGSISLTINCDTIYTGGGGVTGSGGARYVLAS